MNSDKNRPNNEKKKGLQNKDENLHMKNNAPAQEDGFRYDYDDSK